MLAQKLTNKAHPLNVSMDFILVKTAGVFFGAELAFEAVCFVNLSAAYDDMKEASSKSVGPSS